jgi:TatD DNase family protein
VIDAHCHIDRYADPYAEALRVERERVLTVAVTDLPRNFEDAYPHVRGFRSIRLAVGLHPLLADQHSAELDRFERCLQITSFVGEVGLDASPEGRSTFDRQIESFRFVLGLIRRQPKFLSLHSRRAEAQVLDLLEEFAITPAVFHWYTGSVANLDRLIAGGHYCSVNPAMTRSKSGRSIIDRLPMDRVLTETDGPHVEINGRPAIPADIVAVEEYLASRWCRSICETKDQIQTNFLQSISKLPR